jgi:hypothetical protein
LIKNPEKITVKSRRIRFDADLEECDREILMDFTIAASKFMRSGRFLDLELQKELEFAITTIELAVIDNVGLHGRFGLWRSILRDRLDRVTKENARRVRQIPVRPVGWRSIFLPCL